MTERTDAYETRRGRRGRDKWDNGGVVVVGGVVSERRWTEADGAEELTAKQRLSGDHDRRHPSADDEQVPVCGSGTVDRSCFSVQHEFEVAWQSSPPPCYLRQVSVF